MLQAFNCASGKTFPAASSRAAARLRLPALSCASGKADALLVFPAVASKRAALLKLPILNCCPSGGTAEDPASASNRADFLIKLLLLLPLTCTSVAADGPAASPMIAAKRGTFLRLLTQILAALLAPAAAITAADLRQEWARGRRQ